jgi:hypothetical protein
MEQDMQPIKNPGALFSEEFDGWGVLFSQDSCATLALNPTGVMLWKLIDGKRSFREIVDEFTRPFGDAPDSVTNDVRAMMDTLVEDGFVGCEVKA